MELPEVRLLSLWQPWAQLMALGLKTIETRSWPTKYRGLIAIHAGLAFPPEAMQLASELGVAKLIPSTLHFGKILCVVNLRDIGSTGFIDTWASSDVARMKTELRYGNYDPHRFAWFTDKLHVLKEPLEYKGAQGLRRLPPDVVAKLGLTSA